MIPRSIRDSLEPLSELTIYDFGFAEHKRYNHAQRSLIVNQVSFTKLLNVCVQSAHVTHRVRAFAMATTLNRSSAILLVYAELLTVLLNNPRHYASVTPLPTAPVLVVLGALVSLPC